MPGSSSSTPERSLKEIVDRKSSPLRIFYTPIRSLKISQTLSCGYRREADSQGVMTVDGLEFLPELADLLAH